MPNQDTPDQEAMIALKLNAEREREIDDVRKRFETFYIEETKFQAEMKSGLAVVSEQQKGLKERFEEGVSKRLASLDLKFDKFLMEWGKKQEQDANRDKAIKAADKKAEDVAIDLKWLTRSLIISVCSGVLLALVIWAFQNFKG